MPLEKLRYLGLSHFEADECGALNLFLAAAPQAVPVCSQVAAMVSIGDFADRAPRALADGEELALGRHTLKWFDTPHMPHRWECGLMMDMTTRTFFCGDLFTQGGSGEVALTESDILGPSEAFRAPWTTTRTAPQTTGDSRAPGARAAGDAGLHARQRVARGWGEAAARARRIAGKDASPTRRVNGVRPRFLEIGA